MDVVFSSITEGFNRTNYEQGKDCQTIGEANHRTRENYDTRERTGFKSTRENVEFLGGSGKFDTEQSGMSSDTGFERRGAMKEVIREVENLKKEQRKTQLILKLIFFLFLVPLMALVLALEFGN